MRLLIVDDEYAIREGLRDTIDWQALGIDSVSAARNGLEAMQMIQKEVPDILLTDIRMPGMDGLELAGQVSASYPRTRILLLSGYADFSYARQAISMGVKEYFIKPVNIEELVNRISELTSEILTETRLLSPSAPEPEKDALPLHELLRAAPSSGPGANAVIQRLGYRWDKPYTAAGIMEISGRDPALPDACEPFPVTPSELAKKLFTQATREFLLLCHEQPGKFCYFINLNSLDEYNELLHDLPRAASLYADRYNSLLTIAAGDLFPAAELQKAYEDAENTLGFSFFVGKGILLASRHFRQKQFDGPLHPDTIKSALLQAIRRADTEECLSLLAPLFQSYRFGNITHIPQIKDYCLALVTILTDEVGRNSQQAVRDNLLRMGYTVHVQSLCTLEEYIQLVEDFYRDIMDILKLSQASKSRWIVEKAKDYIDSAYTENLTVEMIAAQVDRNPNYLCHIFNSIEGISITEYLNKLRVEKARELLVNTSLMSYEIAEQVGFVNYRYFTQIFKKYSNDSPTGYRNRFYPRKGT